MEQNRGRRLMLGQNNNALTWLIIINAVVFALFYFVKIVYLFSSGKAGVPAFDEQIATWVTLPANLETLSTRPWTVLTHMFTHVSIWGLLTTVLWLWGFGYILQDLTGNNKLIPLYLYGGLVGAVFFVATSNIFPNLRAGINSSYVLAGGGAAVMAVAVATTTLAPGYRIFPMLNGGIPLWVFTLIFVAIDYATIASDNAAFGFAHLSAGLLGFLFIHQLRRGHDWGAWMGSFWNWLDDLFSPEKKHAKKSSGDQHFYKTSKKPFEKKPHFTQQRLDEILDKINQKGYHFLTDEEKEFLKKASEQDL
ncbi:rhomboid family intramembrane serine protease [Foetidibacter luteolus]|uniref:rhomboid family intramembrane serine protease n=1 Tax=Foetidibacter luteolus TaxID=2608880 RepID=UPI001A99D770|nr:rhomboid family intramembrane serine protease [Foetidibacter luteolus]